MPDLEPTVRALCAFARRAPCSDAERRAAGWLRAELARRGHEAWIETHWVRPQWPLALALGAALAVLASVLTPSLPAAGLAVGLLAAASLALEAAGRLSPVRAPFPRRATQVVVTEPRDPSSSRRSSRSSRSRPRSTSPSPIPRRAPPTPSRAEALDPAAARAAWAAALEVADEAGERMSSAAAPQDARLAASSAK